MFNLRAEEEKGEVTCRSGTHRYNMVGQLKKDIEQLTKKLGRYILVEVTRLAQAIAAVPVVHAALSPAALALTAGSTSNPQSCQTPEVMFNPRTDVKSYVPVSKPKVA